MKLVKLVLQVLGAVYILEKLFVLYVVGITDGFPAMISSRLSTPEREHRESRHTTGRGYGEEDRADFASAVLDTFNVEHTQAIREGVYWVNFDKQPDNIEHELDKRVSQYQFVRDVCPKLGLPQPNEPSKEKLSCSTPAE